MWAPCGRDQDGGDGGQEGVDLVFPPLPPRPQVQVILIDWVIHANTDRQHAGSIAQIELAT